MPSLLPESGETPIVSPVDMAEILEYPTNVPAPSGEVGRVGICTECFNVQPDQYMERSPFYQDGQSVPCKFCGGVTTIIREDLINDHTKDRMDQMRGIGSTRQPN